MEEIYYEYSKFVYGYLLSLTKDNEIANELTQETFYSAIKNINKFRNDSSVKTWLYKIAKNKYIDYYKKNKKIKEININEISEDDIRYLRENSLEENFQNRQQIIDIYKKIHKLDENSKEVVFLRLIGELNYKEIGNIMGRSEEWARVTFYRAKIRIKEELKDE